jgi:hypothetical protein
MEVTLNTRSGQSQPLSITEVDENWNSIVAAFAAIPAQSTGTVTSVAITVPSFLSRTGSPITTSGTIAITLASQTTNKVFASPNGSTGTPDFRALVEADLPTISLSKLATTTASRAATFNGSGVLTASSTITTTELDYLDGVTSNIQTQLNAKQATITVLPIANGGSNANTAQGARVNLLPSLAGNAGEFLRVNAGETDVEWAAVTGAIPTINSLSGALTINHNSAGTDFGISSAGATITISLPSASASARGVITTSTQTIAGQKTFSSAPVLPTLDTYIMYSNSGEVAGSSALTFDGSKEQTQIKRSSISERQVSLGFNATFHTTNQNVDPETDFILYFDTSGSSLDCTFFVTTNPAAQIGSVYKIIKPVAANNLVLKVQGSDSIGTLATTTYTLTAVKGWVEVQFLKSGFFSILSTGTIS